MLSTDQTLNKGRYRIINLFSYDDTGGLYEAYDTVNSSNVVLKECVNDLGNLATTDQIQALDAAFAASAKVLTTIRHDSLVSVHDYFSEIGCQYLVLDGVTGLDLTKYLDPDEPRPTLSEVMAWTNKILAGLHHLHRLSPPIIHCDIRPKNIKLTSAMAVKLLTAGIGMDTTVANVQQVSVRSGGNTARNYRPLEQLWSDADQAAKDAILKTVDDKTRKQVLEPLDARSDLYSVGASIYHILTGILPPDAASRASVVHEGKADPLQPPSKIDENIPAEISNAIMKSMAICREDRFDSAVIMNQVLRTAVVRTQERSADGVEKPIQLKALPRNSASKQAPVPEAPVFKTPVIEAPVEVSPVDVPKAEAIEPPAQAEGPKVETPSADALLELETKKAEDLEAERQQLEEEQKRIEARRTELEAERKRLDAEKRRLELEAKQDRESQEKARLEKEADEERKRAAQKIAVLEAERQKRQVEEKRLEMLAEEEKKKAEERLKTLRTEHERIREERRRIEEAEKEELERTEKRLLELSVSPNRESGELPGQEVEEQLLEVDTSDPDFKTTQQIIELLEDEHLPIGPARSKANYYEENEDFELHQERRSGLPLPMIAAAAAILLIVAVGAWMFMSSGSSGNVTPTAAVPEKVSPPVEQPVVGPEQTVVTDPLTAANVADQGNTSVTLSTDPAAVNADQRAAFVQEQERKARQAKLDVSKKPVPSASKSPKKVTVDDLINDN